MRRRAGRPGLLGTVARTAVIAKTAQAVTAGSQQRAVEAQAGRQALADAQQQQLVDQAAAAAAAQLQAQQPTAPPVPVAPAAASSGDRIAQLQALAELRGQGILTDAEFEAEKARILAS